MKLLKPIKFLSVVVPLLVVSLCGGQSLSQGPVVGGVTPNTANIWLRTDLAASVVVHYGTDPALVTFSSSASYSTDASSDFTKIVPISGLLSRKTYYLDIVVNGVSQLSFPYPSFTTFRNSVGGDFTFVVLSDFEKVSHLTGPVQTFASAAALNPVFAFIGGDFDHRNPGTLDTKRNMFRELYDASTQQGYLADFVNLILHKMPIVHQWDDHDAGQNNIDKNYTKWNLSQQVFKEYVPSYPLPALPPGSPGIWQSFKYAQADFFVLDCRSQRDPEEDMDNASKSMLDGNALGATGQLQWLKNGLLASTAVWKVIFTSVTTNITTKCPDGWCGYQTEWGDLKNFIASNHITGVVFISGDLHLGAIDNGANAGFPEIAQFPEMCVSGANMPAQMHCATAGYGMWSEGFYTGSCDGFGIVTVRRNPDRLILQAADQDGVVHVSYVATPQ